MAGILFNFIHYWIKCYSVGAKVTIKVTVTVKVRIRVKATGGSEGQKTCSIVFKDLIAINTMQKTASKNFVPGSSYIFLKIAIHG